MTDAPRSLQPSDAERLAILRSHGFPGGAGGDSRAVGPIASRGVARAQVVGQGDTDTLDESDHQIDSWTITDDATSTFQTTFSPLDDSWNLELNGVRVHLDEFTVAGTTVTIADAADLFLGADTQGSPWLLEMQYDYLAGVPVPPSADLSIVGNVAYAGAFNATFELPPGVMVINSRTAGFTGVLLESGWFNIYSDAEPNAHYRVQGKFVDTEEPGDFVNLHGGSDFICAHVMTIIRGIDLADPVVDFASPNTVVTGTASVTTDGVNPVLYQVTAADQGPLSVDQGTMLMQGSGAAAGHTGYYWSSFDAAESGTVTATVSPVAPNVFMGIVALRPST